MPNGFEFCRNKGRLLPQEIPICAVNFLLEKGVHPKDTFLTAAHIHHFHLKRIVVFHTHNLDFTRIEVKPHSLFYARCQGIGGLQKFAPRYSVYQ